MYYLIHDPDTDYNHYPAGILHLGDDLPEAETKLTYFLNHGHDVHLQSFDKLGDMEFELSCCLGVEPVLPFFDDGFSHFYCAYCGDTVPHPLDRLS